MKETKPGVIVPEIRVPWKVKARQDTGNLHVAKKDAPGIRQKGQPLCKIYRVDWKSLERNKYAPWGRGHNTSLGETVVSF